MESLVHIIIALVHLIIALVHSIVSQALITECARRIVNGGANLPIKLSNRD